MYSNGSYVGTSYHTGNLGTSPLFAGTIQATTGSDSIVVGSSGFIGFTGKTITKSPVDGVLTLLNQAQTDFTRLNFGGVTSSFPALQKNSASSIGCVVADNSAAASISCSYVVSTAVVGNTGAGSVAYGGSVALTVGAAGAAAALPATPVGYIIINVAGTQMKLPYYNT